MAHGIKAMALGQAAALHIQSEGLSSAHAERLHIVLRYPAHTRWRIPTNMVNRIFKNLTQKNPCKFAVPHAGSWRMRFIPRHASLAQASFLFSFARIAPIPDPMAQETGNAKA